MRSPFTQHRSDGLIDNECPCRLVSASIHLGQVYPEAQEVREAHLTVGMRVIVVLWETGLEARQVEAFSLGYLASP